MEKGKQLFSYLGSVFTFCMFLALTVLLPGAKADAALSLEEINYENSTITIGTNSGDTSLYFSDKNKTKWETAMDAFVGGRCTMDISWVSVTKDYVMNFKGDKTTNDILTVTIPKQVSNFKAKYEKKGNKVTFTNKPSDRTVQYRKNNTSNWTPVNENTISDDLQRLCENGAKVYFRLAAVNGSSGNVGKRYSKEVVCSITKKSEAPKITINDDATITVQSGWQVRRVDVKESGGTEYVIGYDKIDSAVEGDTANYDASKKWYMYRSERDVPVIEMAAELKSDNGTSTASEDTTITEEKPVYLQFRKEASSSAQVSHITTVKIPKQEAAPSSDDISIDYTSFTTFNLKIAKATTKNPYEYCIVSESDVKKENEKVVGIIEPEDAKWKMISSNVATEVKKSEAPVNSSIFLRKKAVGKLGDDDFKLATDYVCVIDKLTYPTADNEKLQIQKPKVKENVHIIDLIDGVCTEDNQDGYIKFTITTRWNAKINNIYLMEKSDPTADDKNENVATVTQTSSVTKLKDKIEIDNKEVEGYTITATIKGIKLTSAFAKDFEESEVPKKLYAYIEYDTPGESVGLSSNDAKGLVINLSKKSSIETDSENSDLTKTKDVKRIIGATKTSNNDSQNEEIKYKANLGSNTISSVTLGNYPLKQNHYKLEGGIFTVYLAELEKEKDLEAYYGEKQTLTIQLSNGEKLKDITITFIEPVSLDKLYSWAYRPSAIPNTKQEVVTKLPSGGTTTETKYVNNYSIQYVTATESVNNVTVKTVIAKSAILGSIGILGEFDHSTKKIEFSNDNLKQCLAGLTSEPVKIAFDITLSNGYKYEYVIKQGCMFTVLS